MNLRWLRYDHVPREIPLTPDQRRAVRQEAENLWRTDPRFRRARVWLYFTLVSGALITGVTLFVLVRDQHLAPYIAAGFPGTAVMITGLVYWRMTGARATWIVLNNMGHPVCRECGYMLRGLDADDGCPECGCGRN